jgi:predicted heme/steroid binding protein
MLYLEEEFRNTNKLLSLLSNPATISSYIRELLQLEEDYMRLKISIHHTKPLTLHKRQEMPLTGPTADPTPISTTGPTVAPSMDNLPPAMPTAPPANLPPPRPPTTPPPVPPTTIPEGLIIPDRIFTLDELKTDYTGLNGQPAYVALYGIVFDVSNIATWGGGTHFGLLSGDDASSGARACGFHNPLDIMRIMPAVGYFEKMPPSAQPNTSETDSSMRSRFTPPILNTFFTVEELEKSYNGRDDKLAYVAMNGIVFDVSYISSFHKKNYVGLHSGNDLKRMSKYIPVVGKLKEI